jgi:hypothetical protein
LYSEDTAVDIYKIEITLEIRSVMSYYL